MSVAHGGWERAGHIGAVRTAAVLTMGVAAVAQQVIGVHPVRRPCISHRGRVRACSSPFPILFGQAIATRLTSRVAR